MPGSTTTTTTAAPAFNTPPTLLRLPLEILDAIVFELTELTSLGPPHPTVLPLLLTCKALHAAFSPKRNPALWTRMFRARFDVRAVERRAMRPTYEQCIAQMELWCRTLKVLRRGDVYGVWGRAERRASGSSRSAGGETEAEAEEEGEGQGGPEDDPPDDDELDVEEALFMACVMMLEDDGKNARQLLEYARAYEFAERFVKQRLYEGKEANDGWPCETSINACAVNLLWMLTDEEKLKKESQADRDLMINILLPFVFNPYRYMQAEAPPNHYTLPITRILRTQHISTIETVHGPYPIYAPQRTRTTITFPPPSSVQEAELEPEQQGQGQGQGQDQGQEPELDQNQEQEQQPALDFTLTSRTTRLSRGGTSHVHYLSRPALATPLLAPAAKLLYFARKEVLPLGIPPHLARTREEAVRAGRLAWNEVGVTREDLEEVNWAWGTRMPLGIRFGPGERAALEGGAAEARERTTTTTTGNARWNGKAPHEMMFWRRFEAGKSRRWDLDWWRLRLCASPALVDDDDDEEGDSANASGGPPPPPSPSPLSFLASSSASVSSASLSTPARTQAHAPHAEPDPAALDTRPGSVLPPPWLLTGLWQGRILTPEEATTRELLHNPFHPDFEGVAFARARARARAREEGQNGDAAEQDAALLQQGQGDLAHTRFNETARMVLVRPLYVRLTELHGVRGFGHRASAEERRAAAADPGIGIGGALWEEEGAEGGEGEGGDGEEGEDEDEEDDGLDENMANAWFPGHPGTLKSRVVGQVYHDPSPSHRINDHAAEEASGLTSLYMTEPPFRAPQHHRGDEEGDIVKRDLVELSVDPSLMNDQQHALGVGVAGHGWAGRRNVQQRNRRSVYVRLEDEAPLVEVDVDGNVNVDAGGSVNGARTSRGTANGKARAHGEAWTGHPHDETRCSACEARREVVEAGFRIARRREARLLRSARAAGERGEGRVASVEEDEDKEEERQREERERIWERNGFGMRGRPDGAEGADGGADGDGDEDGADAGEEAEEVAKRWRLEREWWGPDQPLDHLGDAEMEENDDADDADCGRQNRPRHPVRLDPAPFPIDPTKRLGKKCDGVREVVLLGETDERHGLAWHHYTFYGRIRPWDGLIGLLRKPRNPWMGYTFMYGYIVGGENFVGNWRIVSGDDRAPVWESAFVLSKREDV